MTMKCYQVAYSTPGQECYDVIICEEGKVKEELEARNPNRKLTIESTLELPLSKCRVRDLTAKDLLNLISISEPKIMYN